MPQLFSRDELEDLCQETLKRKRSAIIADLARSPLIERTMVLASLTTISAVLGRKQGQVPAQASHH